MVSEKEASLFGYRARMYGDDYAPMLRMGLGVFGCELARDRRLGTGEPRPLVRGRITPRLCVCK